jgi:hypothetical protein
MDNLSIIFESIQFIALIITAIIAGYGVYIINKRQMFNPSLSYLQTEYRKPEMRDAMIQLWKIHDTAALELRFTKRRRGSELTDDEKQRLRDKIKDIYRDTYIREQNLIDSLSNKIQSNPNTDLRTKAELIKIREEAIHGLLDNKRRLVSHFFSHLYDLKQNGLLTEKMLQSFSLGKSGTIRDILIPLEEELVDIIYENRPWINISYVENLKKNTTDKFNKIADMFDNKL